jgi:hypothetical protein
MAKSMGMIPEGHMSHPKGYSEGAHGHGGHHRGSIPVPKSSNHMNNPHIAYPEHNSPKGKMSKMHGGGGAHESVGMGTV